MELFGHCMRGELTHGVEAIVFVLVVAGVPLVVSTALAHFDHNLLYLFFHLILKYKVSVSRWVVCIS